MREVFNWLVLWVFLGVLVAALLAAGHAVGYAEGATEFCEPSEIVVVPDPNIVDEQPVARIPTWQV